MAKMDKVKFLSDIEIEGKLTVTPKPTVGLTYNIPEGKTYAICTGWGTSIDTEIVVAKYYNGCPVTHIGDLALSAANLYPYREISKIVFPDTITHLGENCCRGLGRLKEVVLPLAIQSIGNGAFAACFQLESIKIGKQTTYMGPHVFRNCSNIMIYCEATEQPEGWDLNWNPNNRPVIWGYAPDIPAINDRIISIENNIGDIEAALDAIIEIQEELLPHIIEFVFDEFSATHTLQAIDGMTWSEWCESEYNTVGLNIIDGSPAPSKNSWLQYTDDENFVRICKDSDIILPDTRYYIGWV